MTLEYVSNDRVHGNGHATIKTARVSEDSITVRIEVPPDLFDRILSIFEESERDRLANQPFRPGALHRYSQLESLAKGEGILVPYTVLYLSVDPYKLMCTIAYQYTKRLGRRFVARRDKAGAGVQIIRIA